MNTAKVLVGMLMAAALSGVPAEAQTVSDTFGLSPSSRVLRTAAGPQQFPRPSVRRVGTPDSLKNGIGIGVGVALGAYVGTALLFNPRMPGCGADEPGAGITACLGVVAGAGALIGGAIDAAHSRQLYTRHLGRAEVGVSPTVGTKAGGLRLALSF